MKKYRIHRNFGWVWTEESYVDEFDSEEEANAAAEEYAMERVEFWAEPVEDDE